MSDENNVYLTVNISDQNRDASFPVVYNANTTYPLIDNLKNYSIGVDSATIPTDNLPLWWPIIKPFPNTNNNLTGYTFTMEYNGVFSDIIDMIFISQNPDIIINPLSPTNLTADYNSGYYDIFTVGPLIQMLNNTISDAFINLSGKIALPLNALAPFFTYDYDNNKISLNAQLNYYDLSSVAIPIRIYSNYKMFTLFDKIDFIYQSNSPSNLRFFIQINNENNNVFFQPPSYPPPVATSDDYYIKMTQDISTIANLTPVKSICITSENLKIREDFITATKNAYSIANNNQLIGSEVIVTEFEPIIRVPFTAIGQEYQYRPEYRRYKIIKSGSAQQKIDINVQWRDIFGVLHQVYSNINKVTCVRLVFTKAYKSK